MLESNKKGTEKCYATTDTICVHVGEPIQRDKFKHTYTHTHTPTNSCECTQHL